MEDDNVMWINWRASTSYSLNRTWSARVLDPPAQCVACVGPAPRIRASSGLRNVLCVYLALFLNELNQYGEVLRSHVNALMSNQVEHLHKREHQMSPIHSCCLATRDGKGQSNE